MQGLYEQLTMVERNPIAQQGRQLRVYSYNEVRIFPIDQKLLSMNFQTLKVELVQKQIGYSSRIYLYKSPLCSFNKIDFFTPSASLGELMQEVGQICLTYNNTQYSEEPEYNHQPVYSRPLAADSIETVVQISQNNFFVHENYRVQQSTRVGFFRDICTRYGRNIYVKYYNMRLNLNQFSDESLVQHTFGKLIDHMNRLTITVDSVEAGWGDAEDGETVNCLQKIKENYQINQQFYYKLRIIKNKRDTYYAINRKCKINCVKYLLQILFKQEVVLTQNNEEICTQFVQNTSVITMRLSGQKSPIISLKNQISNCQLVGQFPSTCSTIFHMVFIEQSKILRHIMIDTESLSLIPVCTRVLPCPPTAHLNQDLFFVRGNYIIGYSINISMIKVKYFSMAGEFLFLRIWPWYHDIYGDIQFVVVDLFCVRIKQDKKKVKVFYIDNPEQFIEISPCDHFFPARVGSNVFSDGTGLFATTNQWCQSVQIYQIGKKQKMFEIKLTNYKSLTDVFFTEVNQGQRKVVLNFSNKQLSVYSIGQKQLLQNILCEKGMKNFMTMGETVVCCSGTEVRQFRNIRSDLNNPQKQKKQMQQISREQLVKSERWGDPIHIPQKCVIVLPSGQLMVRQNLLQFTSFSKVYLFNQIYI